MSRQAVLFTPGDEQYMVEKSLASDADMVILDIEDAVAPNSKEDAGHTITEVLMDQAPSSITTEVSVRINPLSTRGEEDLSVLRSASEKIQNIVLPKLEGVETVNRLSELLKIGEFESHVIPIIETPSSLLELREIANHPLVDALEFGAEDFTTEIGGLHTTDRMEIQYARQRIVTVAAAAGIDALDMAWPDIEDTEGLRRNAQTAVEFGYDGKSAIHPAQVEIIHDVFTPDDERIEWAERVLARAKKAREQGKVVFQLNGEMIDPPIIDRAETILERASR